MQIYLIFFLEGHYFLDIQYIKKMKYMNTKLFDFGLNLNEICKEIFVCVPRYDTEFNFVYYSTTALYFKDIFNNKL